MKTSMKKNGRAQRGNCLLSINPFVKGKAVIKTSIDFYKGKWPRAARKFFVRLFMKGNAI